MRDDENRLVAESKKDRGQRRLQIASVGKVHKFDKFHKIQSKKGFR